MRKLKKLFGLLKEAKPDKYYNQKQLNIGMKIELEHTNNIKVAKRIAKHHLDEFPSNYYTELIKMEKRIRNY